MAALIVVPALEANTGARDSHRACRCRTGRHRRCDLPRGVRAPDGRGRIRSPLVERHQPAPRRSSEPGDRVRGDRLRSGPSDAGGELHPRRGGGWAADGGDDYGDGSVSHTAGTILGGTNEILEATGREEDGRTTVESVISLATRDAMDKMLVPGETCDILVAYNNTSDSFALWHSRRGSGMIRLDDALQPVYIGRTNRVHRPRRRVEHGGSRLCLLPDVRRWPTVLEA